jgi:hypothetical protein
MSIDYVVYWKDKKPSKEQIWLVAEDFFGGIAKVSWDSDRFLVTLPGKVTNPFVRISPWLAEEESAKLKAGLARTERFLELYQDDERTYLAVIVRQQDDFVMSLAEGLAMVFCRFWQGDYVKPS